MYNTDFADLQIEHSGDILTGLFYQANFLKFCIDNIGQKLIHQLKITFEHLNFMCKPFSICFPGFFKMLNFSVYLTSKGTMHPMHQSALARFYNLIALWPVVQSPSSLNGG